MLLFIWSTSFGSAVGQEGQTGQPGLSVEMTVDRLIVAREAAVPNKFILAQEPDGSTPPTEETPLLSAGTASLSTLVDEAEDETEVDRSTPTTSALPCRSNPYLGGVSVDRFWVIFLEIMAAYFIACFDGTIMASSHPAITSYFGASNKASWLSTAFLLTGASFQPLLGRLSDAVGRKPPYVASMAVFLAATLWCATAGSMTSLIVARAFCGLGAGGIMTLGSILISDLVPIEIRANYQSLLNLVFGVGAMLGAALGGLMVDTLGWRWGFGIQVPILFVNLIVAIVAVPPGIGLHGKTKESVGDAMRAFDFAGSLSMATAVVFLILGLNLGGNILPWTHPFVIASLLISLIVFPLFLYIETRASRPIMPLNLVTKSPHMNLIFSNFLANMVMNAIMFNVPLYFRGVLLTSATTSGLSLIVPSGVASLSGAMTGFLISWTRRLKWPLVLGTTSSLLGLLSLAAMQRGWPTAAYLGCLVPSAIAQGLQFPGTTMAVLATSEQHSQAVVTSTLILWRSVGTVLGIAASSLVVQNALWAYLAAFVRGPDSDGVIARVRLSVEAIRALPAPYREQVVQSYEAALRLTFLCASVLAAVSIVLVLPVKLPKLGGRKEKGMPSSTDA
ncbi:hypothetical protein P8C59_000794 [Phyllachora maydis]|uniref:Major facilitator superfamily (MFS) profile domain-containing protein n=1 Tax=Phyllachora maydis TaxID=1825666 RepID=A0AAD9HY53_9PEZI|nr:hypothetical protein P8C59_000794 [Phyllachora maydis]